MSTLFITDKGHDRVIVRTLKRNPRFFSEMQQLKRRLPPGAIEWSRGGARWFVHRDALPRVEALGKRCFDRVKIQEVA